MLISKVGSRLYAIRPPSAGLQRAAARPALRDAMANGEGVRIGSSMAAGMCLFLPSPSMGLTVAARRLTEGAFITTDNEEHQQGLGPGLVLPWF